MSDGEMSPLDDARLEGPHGLHGFFRRRRLPCWGLTTKTHGARSATAMAWRSSASGRCVGRPVVVSRRAKTLQGCPEGSTSGVASAGAMARSCVVSTDSRPRLLIDLGRVELDLADIGNLPGLDLHRHPLGSPRG